MPTATRSLLPTEIFELAWRATFGFRPSYQLRSRRGDESQVTAEMTLGLMAKDWQITPILDLETPWLGFAAPCREQRCGSAVPVLQPDELISDSLAHPICPLHSSGYSLKHRYRQLADRYVAYADQIQDQDPDGAALLLGWAEQLVGIIPTADRRLRLQDLLPRLRETARLMTPDFADRAADLEVWVTEIERELA